MSESQTPRTDAETYGGKGIIGAGYVAAHFARQLESELTATRARLAELEGIAELLYILASSDRQGVDVFKRYEAYKEGKK